MKVRLNPIEALSPHTVFVPRRMSYHVSLSPDFSFPLFLRVGSRAAYKGDSQKLAPPLIFPGGVEVGAEFPCPCAPGRDPGRHAAFL